MIGVIADDLSGAAEIGAVGLRFGLRAEIVCGTVRGSVWAVDLNGNGRIGGARALGKNGHFDELICIDTDSRSCDAGEAAGRAARAARVLSDAGALWIYKKVDSVLRGRVTAEVQSIMAELKLRRALLVPANPSRRRIIRNGRYLVGDKPIHETEFAQDPEYPRTSARVFELLGCRDAGAIHLVRPRGVLPAAGLVVGEAGSEADLKRWAGHRRRKLLMAGAAEFFAALLAERGPMERQTGTDLRSQEVRIQEGVGMVSPALSLSEPLCAGPSIGPAQAGADVALAGGLELFVCGTTSKSARDFLRNARAARTPVFSLPSELLWGAEFTGAALEAVTNRVLAAFRQHARVILCVGLPAMRGPALPRLLTSHLVQLSGNVLRRIAVRRVYAEGGATGAALVQRMGWTHMEVLREVAPGVATLGVGAKDGMLLTLKPGSYVWPAEIRRIHSVAETRNDPWTQLNSDQKAT